MVASHRATRHVASELGVAETPFIATSARKRGVHDHDMIRDFDNPKFVDDHDDGFVRFVGVDTSGNLLEIGVIESARPNESSAPQSSRLATTDTHGHPSVQWSAPQAKPLANATAEQ